MALVPIIITAAKVAQKVYKHRKAIYAVLTAQDRYISSAFRYGGYGKATSYGVRSGALAGSIAGAFITNSGDTPGNGVPKPFHGTAPSTPHKTRSGQPSRDYSRYSRYSKPRTSRRCPSPRKRY